MVERGRTEHRPGWTLLARRVRRIGVLQLFTSQLVSGRVAVSLDNRTYHGWHEVPADNTDKWLDEFDLQDFI